MSWIRKAIRRWLNRDDSIEVGVRPSVDAYHNFGEQATSVQLFKAMNGTILVLHMPPANQPKSLGARQTGPTMYILKDGESIQDAVATLLVKARLDSM